MKKKEKAKEEKNKKTKLPLWAIVLIVVFGLLSISPILLVVCGLLIDNISNGDVEKDLKINSVISAGCNEKNDAYVITGTIKNISDKNYTGINISYDLFDNDKNIVGTADTYIDRMDKGITWKFSAQYDTPNCKDVVSYKFYKLDGYTDSFLFD